MSAIYTLMKTLSSLKIESIDRAYIGLIGGIIGSFSTFLLTGWRQWRIEIKQAYAARLMLSLEIDQNLELLKDYWEKVNQIESTDDERELYVQRLNRLTLLPMPEFISHTWRSQTVMLASAINKNEIKQIHYLYSYLNTIKMIYCRIIDFGKEDREIALLEREDSLKTLGVGFFSPPSVSKSSWNEFEQLICKVIEDGNPLQTQ